MYFSMNGKVPNNSDPIVDIHSTVQRKFNTDRSSNQYTFKYNDNDFIIRCQDWVGKHKLSIVAAYWIFTALYCVFLVIPLQ